ncbi:mannitol dehydrogenase family protein [Colwellia sp. 1_MG-2023]|uniref:mannitol dehydrogenase family protein n=1 Tax=Colwellia sp. 1_MG-2023 TaxID=3062649 RepID=UPI0026E2AD5D|nr:mannitol dehydrogenase family protein [Colwellia sp. 1_MG-2023]MDO6446972.1 mannitol dehydrogenase family protein [Colwellia sp. 1_MG-2023]
MEFPLMNLTDIMKTANTSPYPIELPRYNRENTQIGIVHIGPGAFHRAHQAVYTENLMNQFGGNWAICGVSLRSATAQDILSKQDNLYTVSILDKDIRYQIVGAIKEILIASEQRDLVLQRMSAETTKLITLTITEKGYCLAADGSLDFNHDDIKHDIANASSPVSAIGFIVESLKIRKQDNIPAFNVLSCDNVSGNGDKLRRAVLDYAGKLDPQLQLWIEKHVAFPNSMVDSITPKTEAYTVESVSKAIGCQDNWPIQREAFTQWVISNDWQGERPEWEKVGVIFTQDVEGFEKAKLKLLNCLHSTLAYLGSLAGYETVFDVTSDVNFKQFITKLAQQEIIGSFTPPTELNIEKYSNDIIQRFLNPAIRHLLAQIACDGSQKIQIRLLPIIRDNLEQGRSTKMLCFALACWFEFICKTVKNKEELSDPMASTFYQTTGLLSEDIATVVKSFLSIDAINAHDLLLNSQISEQIEASLTLIRQTPSTQLGAVIAKL